MTTEATGQTESTVHEDDHDPVETWDLTLNSAVLQSLWG